MVVKRVFISFTTRLWWLFSVTFWLTIRKAKQNLTKPNASIQQREFLFYHLSVSFSLLLFLFDHEDHPCHAIVSEDLSLSFFYLVITSFGFQFLTHALSSQSQQIQAIHNNSAGLLVSYFRVALNKFVRPMYRPKWNVSTRLSKMLL